MAPIRVVLLDIEGTVCPISFVKDVLFPYALEALPGTLKAKWDSPEFAPYRAAFPAEHAGSQESLAAHVRDLMSKDLKISYLKSLQGYLWETGYRNGELKAPLFLDVAPQLARWREHGGVKVMIYSSGSVPAQKLLFGHTNGEPSDILPWLSDFFDTVNAGPKQEKASYEKIAAKHQEYPIGEWLFLSDNVKEVEAAKQAGMQSYIVDRPGNAELPEEARKQHRVIKSFEEIGDL
ncbi:enolase-phosphatase E1 [Neurospora hispaniola]|uniref:Enolase-phosphatase E1 n=1 Tax=Neurospora hispaniola TaxID=588809 RepID=A0AAJ0MSB5_9PEZI|nr:enolase-phosphatase E1 [Neurospora hispaniola]